jgi:nitrate reductase gamma subunit
MVDTLIALASGPLLRLALLLAAIGLARVILLQSLELVLALRRAGDMVVAWPVVARRTLSWLLPSRPFRRRARAPYNLASIVFHAGVLIVPLFLWGHVALWERATGLSWWTLPPSVADGLSLVTVAAIVWLLLSRALTPVFAHLSRAQDWALPILLLVVFLAGLAAAHPRWSPMDARAAYLLHLLSAELLIVLVPFSKLQHVLLFWTSQVSTELGWRFVPGSGERVRLTLGREGRGV